MPQLGRRMSLSFDMVVDWRVANQLILTLRCFAVAESVPNERSSRATQPRTASIVRTWIDVLLLKALAHGIKSIRR